MTPPPTSCHPWIGRPIGAIATLIGETAMGRDIQPVAKKRLPWSLSGLAAQRAGMMTALVLTGLTVRAMVAESEILPDYVFADSPA